METTLDAPFKGSRWIGRIASALPAAFLMFDVGIKLVHIEAVSEASARLGLPDHMNTGLAFLLAACLVLYLVPKTAPLGAVLLTGYLGGAVAIHLRIGDPAFSHNALSGLCRSDALARPFPSRRTRAKFDRRPPMKFLMTYEQNPDAPPPTPEKMAQIGAYTRKMMQSGVVVMTGGLVRPQHGIHIRCEKGKTSVIDGPFAETKELIDGFALVEVKSKDEAIALAAEFMGIAGDGTGEILQVFDPGGGATHGSKGVTAP
jgi:hypothetical protein